MNRIFVHQIKLGELDNFIYLWADRATRQTAVVDPAWNAPLILSEALRLGLDITSVLLTHGHNDHTNALGEILREKDVPVYLSSQELEKFRPDVEQLTELEDGQELSVGEMSFTAIHTPGHSPGGMCFHSPGHLLTGDTLFVDGCGRCDLVGGDVDALYDSLHNTILELPESTIIYPGHDYGERPTDTLENQKETNPYLQATDRDEFVKLRMGE